MQPKKGENDDRGRTLIRLYKPIAQCLHHMGQRGVLHILHGQPLGLEGPVRPHVVCDPQAMDLYRMEAGRSRTGVVMWSQAALAAHATLQSYCDYRAHKIRLNCAFGQKSLHCLYCPDL